LVFNFILSIEARLKSHIQFFYHL